MWDDARQLNAIAVTLMLIAIAFLSGTLRQGRIGVGGAAIRAAHDVPPAETASLTIEAVNAVFQDLSAISGEGSARARQDRLRGLFMRRS